MSGRGKGGIVKGFVSTFFHHLAAEVMSMAGGSATNKKKQKKRKNSEQCFCCQKLGHLAKSCKGALACMKCANCGGSHAANARSCSYFNSWRGEQKKKHTAKTISGGKVEEEVRATQDEFCKATDDAVLAFKAAMAEERAALRAEIDAARRKIQDLTQELRAVEEEAAALAHSHPGGKKPGVDAATQTPAQEVAASAPRAPAAMQEAGAAPMETEVAPPPPRVRKRSPSPCLPIPRLEAIGPALQMIAASFEDGSYPHDDRPYPFNPPDVPAPTLPHKPFPFTPEHLELCSTVFTPREWSLFLQEIERGYEEEEVAPVVEVHEKPLVAPKTKKQKKQNSNSSNR